MKLDALAGLRPRLILGCTENSRRSHHEGQFASVQQAIGTARANTTGAAFIREFVQDAKKSGLVARLIEKHNVQGLSVAASRPGRIKPDAAASLTGVSSCRSR